MCSKNEGEYLADVDAQSNARMAVIMEYSLQKEGGKEDLKVHNQAHGYKKRFKSVKWH